MKPEGERLSILETEMNNLSKKVDDGFRAADVRFDKMEDLMTKFIEKSEARFAGKWVEKVLWGSGAIIGAGILVALLRLILIQ